MKTMTPYAFAFSIIRVIAVLMISAGAWGPLAFLIEKTMFVQGNWPGDFSFTFRQIALTALPGFLLYVLAHRLAKAAVHAKVTVDRSSNPTICSFCGKSHAEVRKLIAGPGVYICNNCVIVCKNLLDKEESHK